MKQEHTLFTTVIGTIYSIIEMNPDDLLSTFIFGGVGAAGAFAFTKVIAWLFNLIYKAFKKHDSNK